MLRFLRLTFRLWLGFGAVALVYVFLTACSPTTNPDGSLRIESTSLDNQADQLRLEEAQKLWLEEKEGDAFIAGKAAYDIAQLTKQPQWSYQAIGLLGKAREQTPEFSLTTAYLGSSHGLAARDFPLQGLWQLLPGPGFVRIYHVKKAENLLDEAVEQDPQNPIVRLIRASTIIKMPRILVNHDKALDDFELLAKWDENPDTNSDFADELGSVEWRQSFYKNYAESLSELGNTERANFYQQKLDSLSQQQ